MSDRPAWRALALCNVPILGLLAVATATVGLGEALAWLVVLATGDGLVIRRLAQNTAAWRVPGWRGRRPR